MPHLVNRNGFYTTLSIKNNKNAVDVTNRNGVNNQIVTNDMDVLLPPLKPSKGKVMKSNFIM